MDRPDGLQEAGGEPFEGKLAVAYVIRNRLIRWGSVTDVIFAPFQFSCWNTESATRKNLDQISGPAWAESYTAA